MHKAIKIVVFVLILAFYASLVVHKIELPVYEDLGRHIKNGEMIWQGDLGILYRNVYSYPEPEHAFINHHWLSGVVFYLVYQMAGWGGLVIFKVIVLLVAFSLLFSVAIKRANYWLVAFFSVPTIFILSERTTLRPEIFSYLFTVIFLYFLFDLEEHPERKRIFWLVPLQLIWVNLHLFFVVGIGLVGGFLVSRAAPSGPRAVLGKLTILLLALVAVSFINPNGLMGAFYPLQIFNNYGINVAENNSPAAILKERLPQDNISIKVFFWAILLLAVSFLPNFKSKNFFYFLTGLTSVIGGLFMIRLLPFFALMFLPIASVNLNEAFNRLKNAFEKKKNHNFFRNLKITLLCLFIGILGYYIYLGNSGKLLSYLKPGLGLTPTSNGAAEFFKNQELKGPIFNGFDIGSYLIYHLYPSEKVFVDNRSEAYSSSFLVDTYSAIKNDENKWQEALEKYKFNAIFLYLYESDFRNFTYRRINDPLWSLVYADSYGLIFLRNNRDNAEIIERFKIDKVNVGQKLQPLIQSENYEDQVAAADVFNLFNRFDLGKKTLLEIASKWPEKSKIWLLLGQMEYNGDSRSAVVYMEKAISLGHETAEAYDYLGRSYLWTRQFKKAQTAFEKALKLNPNYREAKYLKELLQWLWFEYPYGGDELPEDLMLK